MLNLDWTSQPVQLSRTEQDSPAGPRADVAPADALARPAFDPARLSVGELSPFSLPPDWEAFSARCGCTHAYVPNMIVTRAILGRVKGPVRCFEIFADQSGDRKKVAQVAIITKFGRHTFLERLAIPPEFANLWLDCMRLLLERLGAGDYTYGAKVSDERDRSRELAGLAGVTIKDCQHFFTQSVYFKDYDSWESYYRGVGTNAKRNHKRATRTIDQLNIVTRRGPASIVDFWFLLRCYRNVAATKNIRLPVNRLVFEFFFRAAILGDRHFVSVVRSGSTRLSAISGVEFGSKLSYIHGGRGDDDRPGAAWYLMIESLREFSRRHPDGVYLFGTSDCPARDQTRSDGLLRSRMACRATDVGASLFTFRFDLPSR
jgi:hypothetical protein